MTAGTCGDHLCGAGWPGCTRCNRLAHCSSWVTSSCCFWRFIRMTSTGLRVVLDVSLRWATNFVMANELCDSPMSRKSSLSLSPTDTWLAAA
eukprot:3756628-Amphidinium_carterae.1